MKVHAQKLAKYKMLACSSIRNLRMLEKTHSKAVQNSVQDKRTQALIQETSAMICRLENLPTQKIIQTSQKRKRKRKRRNANLRRNIKYQNKSNDGMSAYPFSVANQITNQGFKEKFLHNPNIPSILHDSNRFLRIFELLERILIASSDKELTTAFSAKLRKLRSVWNVLRLDSQPKKITPLTDIKRQWENVLFGVQEHSYYTQKNDFKYYLDVRKKWDSYVAPELNVGSNIPPGWVLPHKNAECRWQRYRK